MYNQTTSPQTVSALLNHPFSWMNDPSFYLVESVSCFSVNFDIEPVIFRRATSSPHHQSSNPSGIFLGPFGTATPKSMMVSNWSSHIFAAFQAFCILSRKFGVRPNPVLNLRRALTGISQRYPRRILITCHLPEGRNRNEGDWPHGADDDRVEYGGPLMCTPS